MRFNETARCPTYSQAPDLFDIVLIGRGHWRVINVAEGQSVDTIRLKKNAATWPFMLNRKPGCLDGVRGSYHPHPSSTPSTLPPPPQALALPCPLLLRPTFAPALYTASFTASFAASPPPSPHPPPPPPPSPSAAAIAPLQSRPNEGCSLCVTITRQPLYILEQNAFLYRAFPPFAGYEGNCHTWFSQINPPQNPALPM